MRAYVIVIMRLSRHRHCGAWFGNQQSISRRRVFEVKYFVRETRVCVFTLWTDVVSSAYASSLAQQHTQNLALHDRLKEKLDVYLRGKQRRTACIIRAIIFSAA